MTASWPTESSLPVHTGQKLVPATLAGKHAESGQDGP